MQSMKQTVKAVSWVEGGFVDFGGQRLRISGGCWNGKDIIAWRDNQAWEEC